MWTLRVDSKGYDEIKAFGARRSHCNSVADQLRTVSGTREVDAAAAPPNRTGRGRKVVCAKPHHLLIPQLAQALCGGRAGRSEVVQHDEPPARRARCLPRWIGTAGHWMLHAERECAQRVAEEGGKRGCPRVPARPIMIVWRRNPVIATPVLRHTGLDPLAHLKTTLSCKDA